MMKRITPEMLEGLTDLFVDTFNAPPWNDLWSREQARTRLLDITKRPKFLGLADVRDGRTVAMVMGHAEQSYDGLHFQILEFCVANDMKGQGIGAEMMKQFTDYLEKKGITAVYLLTMRASSGEDFYLKQGFKTISDMCVMSKRYGS